MSDFTAILTSASAGDPVAAERLWSLVNEELRLVAKARIARLGRRELLQTTVLVQEAYLRLMGGARTPGPANRRHFFAAAANAMRQFIVDDVRKRGRLKRGNGRKEVQLGETAADLGRDPAEVLALDEALAKLRRHDEVKAEIVQLRYFAGLTIDETAELLGMSPRTVDAEWRFAKAWLHRELS